MSSLESTHILKNVLDLSGTEQAKRRHAKIGQSIRDDSEQFAVCLALHLGVGCDIGRFIAAFSVETMTACTTGRETVLASGISPWDLASGRFFSRALRKQISRNKTES